MHCAATPIALGSGLAVARERPEVRARLAAVWPDPRGGNDDAKLAFKQSWIELLAELGALDGLPDEGLGAWFGKLFKYAGKTSRTEAILRRHAPRLAALGQPVAVLAPSGWRHELHLDLAELALELGVALADPRHWDDFVPDSMMCDPIRVAAEPRYGKKLIAAVENMMGDAGHEQRMAGKAGFAAARRAWIAEQLSALDGKSLVDIATALDALDAKTTAETISARPRSRPMTSTPSSSSGPGRGTCAR